MRAVLIDDEENAVLSLKMALDEYCPEIEVVGVANSAKNGISEIEAKNPEVVFLDIQLPHMTGIELLESFGDDRSFEVIFVTAFSDFAVKAFRLSATDYLLKPLSINELVSAVQKLCSRQAQVPSLTARIKKIKAALSGKIAIPTFSGQEFVPVHDIVRIQADGSYSVLHYMARKQQIVSKNLKEFELALEGESFFRIHKSHLINLKHVLEYSPVKDGGTLKMSDGSCVEISRTHKTELSAVFRNFLK